MARQSTFLSGAYGKAVFGSATIDLSGWTMAIGGDDGELTNSGTPGLKYSQVINNEYTGRIRGQVKNSAMPWRTTVNLNRGEIGTLKLYVSAEAYIQIPVEIKTMDVDAPINDMIKFEATWMGTGVPTWPAISHLSSSSSSQSVSSSSSSTSSSS